MTTNDAINQAFVANPFATLAGIALCMAVFYLGLSLLLNGWPRFGSKK